MLASIAKGIASDRSRKLDTIAVTTLPPPAAKILLQDSWLTLCKEVAKIIVGATCFRWETRISKGYCGDVGLRNSVLEASWWSWWSSKYLLSSAILVFLFLPNLTTSVKTESSSFSVRCLASSTRVVVVAVVVVVVVVKWLSVQYFFGEILLWLISETSQYQDAIVFGVSSGESWCGYVHIFNALVRVSPPALSSYHNKYSAHLPHLMDSTDEWSCLPPIGGRLG